MKLYDAHCHIGFAENACEVANLALKDGVGVFSCTVHPRDYDVEASRFRDHENVVVGVGMHPWWVADGSVSERDVELFCERALGSPFVGEIGLDFGKRHGLNMECQLSAFERAAHSCAGGGKVLSVHAVNAAGEALDVLERNGVFDGNICIFHWFSGSSPELVRAVRSGCYFSVNEMMLDTKRGRECARQIPLERLLVETDWPQPDVGILDYALYKQALERTYRKLEELRGAGTVERIAQTSVCVFDSVC